MGAVFSVPLARAEQLSQLPGTKIALVAEAGDELWRFSSDSPNQIANVRETPGPLPLTLLIGAEREGLPAELVAAADHVAHIPIQTHSLNAAMAATVALYEVTRMAAR
jgi:TrmH family RNA methyltransferase